MCRFWFTRCVRLSLVAPALRFAILFEMNWIHENQQASKLAHGNGVGDGDGNDYSKGYEPCIIMANEMKSSYSLNSFKLFIVVWALCLPISKMPVKSFTLSECFAHRIELVVMGVVDEMMIANPIYGMVLYVTCAFLYASSPKPNLYCWGLVVDMFGIVTNLALYVCMLPFVVTLYFYNMGIWYYDNRQTNRLFSKNWMQSVQIEAFPYWIRYDIFV